MDRIICRTKDGVLLEKFKLLADQIARRDVRIMNGFFYIDWALLFSVSYKIKLKFRDKSEFNAPQFQIFATTLGYLVITFEVEK